MTESANNSATVMAPALSQDEVNQIRERIRMEERSKLQSKLEKYEASQQELVELHKNQSALIQESTQSKAELAKVQEQFNALQNSVKDKNVDVAKLIREVSEKAEARFSGEVKDQISQLANTVKNMERENAVLKVESYKQRRIAEETAKGTKFILELIAGNTEAEVEASLNEAAVKFRSYFGAGAPAMTPAPSSTAPAPVVTQGVTPVRNQAEDAAQGMRPSVPPASDGVAGIVADLTGKKGKDVFKSNREALLAAADAEAARTVGLNAMVR